MPKFSEIEDQLNEFEKIMDSYYRRDPVAESNALLSRAVDSFNEWAETSNAKLETERVALEHQLESLHQIKAQVNSIDQRLEHERPDPQDTVSVEAYNHLVDERNALAQKHQELSQSYKQNEKAYDDRVQGIEREMTLRKDQVEAAKRNAEGQFNTYRRWVKEREPERFFNELNRFYASLHQEARRTGESSGELQQYINQVRGIRSELGAHAKRQQEMAEDGILVVQAMLCRSEECFMFVDTGAAVVSITPELVDVLGLADHIGDEVEISLAGGIHIKALRLVLPGMSVQGVEAEYVKAVVLKESYPGVDGCIGLSFLNRFNYHIEKGRPQKLLLRPIDRPKNGPSFDVFISYKAEDFSYAKSVFDLLTASGYHPFLSELSLQSRGETDFQKAIDAALEAATHLIVVGSSRENIQAPWVEAEWRLFISLKRSGRKRGNIITILCGDMTIDDLPATLSYYQAISISDPSWETKLRNYLPVY